MRGLAGIWLAIVVLAGAYLTVHVKTGLPLQTDILALLPAEEQNPAIRKANDIVTRELSRKVVVMVSHAGRDEAREAARAIGAAIEATGLTAPIGDEFSIDRMKRIGALYFPHRNGLLSAENRDLLGQGKGEVVAEKALAQVFGVGTIADAGLLRADPFLLMPDYMLSLPFPRTKIGMDDGLLSATDGTGTHIVLLATLTAEPYALDIQKKLVSALDQAVSRNTAKFPGLEVKRLGAVFYAAAGAKQAVDEASTLSVLSFLGITLLIVFVFRRVRPVFQNLIVVAVGVTCGTAATLWLFGEIHIASLLFGISLIGVAVDYGLYYTTSIFDGGDEAPRARLARVLPGIGLGLLMTAIGYGALAIAPFPGLRQIALFSAIGLVGSCLTVILWLPLGDRSSMPQHGSRLLASVSALSALWQIAGRRKVLFGAALVALALCAVAASRFAVDDDVHHLQALDPGLVVEQKAITGMIGANSANQFLLVSAADDEEALKVQEVLQPALEALHVRGVFSGFQMPAGFVPSMARQTSNAKLVAQYLTAPLEQQQRETLGLEGEMRPPPANAGLSLSKALDANAVPYLNTLVLAPGLHIVTFQNLTDPVAVKHAVAGMANITFIDPAGDYSVLLEKYRVRMMILTGVFAAIALAILVVRYRGWKGVFLFAIPAITVALTVAVLALIGQAFTFFHAVGLILILVFTLDYTVFGAESRLLAQPVTLLAMGLAAITALLSFGILAVSKVPAVHHFGSTMLIGITLAILITPLAVVRAER